VSHIAYIIRIQPNKHADPPRKTCFVCMMACSCHAFHSRILKDMYKGWPGPRQSDPALVRTSIHYTLDYTAHFGQQSIIRSKET
jgi:hypothetical protein